MSVNVFQIKSKPGDKEQIHFFIKEGLSAIGWAETGSLEGVDKEGIRSSLKRAYQYEGQSLLTNLGTINTFVNVIKPGDVVLIADKRDDTVHIGIVGEYKWEPRYEGINCSHMRPVEWKDQVKRGDLNTEVRSLLRNGTSVTKFKHPFHEAELERYLGLNPILQPTATAVDPGGNTLATRALKVLESQLNSNNEQIAHEAAKEILRYLKS